MTAKERVVSAKRTGGEKDGVIKIKLWQKQKIGI